MNDETRLLLALLLLTPGCYQPSSGDMDTGLEASTGTGDSTADDAVGGSSGDALSPDGSGSGDGAETEPEEVIDFADTFEIDTGAWTFVDEAAATQEAPSDWAYVGGDLVQRADISGPDGMVPTSGTFAVGGDPDWDVYEVEASWTADDDGVVGVMCHVADATHWVRLSLDHESGLARLVASNAEQVTLLAEASVTEGPVPLEIRRTMSLDCEEGYFGYVDGVLVVQAPADPDAEGAVGLYASSIGDGPTGLRFHEVHVTND